MTDFIDLNLKAVDETAMDKALLAVGFIQDEESGEIYHPEASIDVIGVIRKQTGTDDDLAVEVLDGFHVNIRTLSQALAESLSELRIYPTTPARVWA